MDSKADYERFVMELGLGEVGKMTLIGGETIRSVKPRLTNAGKRLGIELEIWSVGAAIYFRRAGARFVQVDSYPTVGPQDALDVW